MKFINEFRDRTSCSKEVQKFNVICGDFNSDNMSPGDKDVQTHPIFEEYKDICIKKPGEDKAWAVGTELRQRMLFKPEICTAELFQKALLDPSKRRLYVLDADVMEHTSDLVNSVVTLDDSGYIEPVSYGGMRRVDKILCQAKDFKNISGYGFITALTNLTDHLPVCMTLKIDYHFGKSK